MSLHITCSNIQYRQIQVKYAQLNIHTILILKLHACPYINHKHEEDIWNRKCWRLNEFNLDFMLKDEVNNILPFTYHSYTHVLFAEIWLGAQFEGGEVKWALSATSVFKRPQVIPPPQCKAKRKRSITAWITCFHDLLIHVATAGEPAAEWLFLTFKSSK